MSVSEGGPFLVNSASVGASYDTVAVESVTNLDLLPSTRTTVISSPFRIRPSDQKTAGPFVQSRCPASTASPTSPGDVPGRYQATLLAREGVAIRPWASRPTGSTGAST